MLFLGFPTKNHRQTSVLKLEKKSENNRNRWLNKNNRTDCDGKNVQKPSTSHRCYIKNIGITSLSKIDHRSSLGHTLAHLETILVGTATLAKVWSKFKLQWDEKACQNPTPRSISLRVSPCNSVSGHSFEEGKTRSLCGLNSTKNLLSQKSFECGCSMQ